MKIGSIVYATEQGLGYLAHSFYDHGVVDEVIVAIHSSRQTMPWYPGSEHIPIRSIASNRLVKEFCREMDLMLFFETPFDWSLIEFCKSVGVKTALMPMFECMPKSHPKADITLCPSLLDKQYYPDGVFIPVPVDFTWKERSTALTFVHNAGHGGLKGRNGTVELLAAMTYVKSPLKLVVRSQSKELSSPDPRIIFEGRVPQSDLYAAGDVFVFPEKFNGLSLPLQEAYASGMLVMATRRFPMDTWLPDEPLIHPFGYRMQEISGRCLPFQEAIVEPTEIARTMDAWYGKDITEFSRKGREWAKQNSWNALRSKYLEVLQ